MLFSPSELKELKNSINKQKEVCIYNNQKQKLDSLNGIYNALSNIERNNKRA